jgi:hypothetical protein
MKISRFDGTSFADLRYSENYVKKNNKNLQLKNKALNLHR